MNALVDEAEVAVVDRLALKVSLARGGESSEEATAFGLAWEAWSIWANGGFEGVLANPSGDHVALFVSALHLVGASEHAALFQRAWTTLPSEAHDFSQRIGFLASGSAEAINANRALAELDREMGNLPSVKVRLGELLALRPALRAEIESVS